MRAKYSPAKASFILAAVMAGIGLSAALVPLKAQPQELLCHYYFPGCTTEACQALCNVGFPESTGFCQGPGGECCNSYY